MNKDVEDKLNPALKAKDGENPRRFASLVDMLDSIGYKDLITPQRKNLVFVTSLALEDYHSRLEDPVVVLSAATVNTHSNLSAYIVENKGSRGLIGRPKSSGIPVEDLYAKNLEWFLLRGPNEENIINLWKRGV